MQTEYIRKDVALDALKTQADTMRTWVERYAEQRRGILTAVNIIEDVEPVDVAPVRHGKWIFVHPLSPDDGGAYLCSECEKGDWDIKLSDKFCKFCGAKMDGEE